MVRVLIDLRRTLARRQLAGTQAAVTWATVALVLLSAIGTLLLGLVDHDDPGAGVSVVALTSLLWVGGRIAQSAMAGEPFLRPELFALLPLHRRRLAWSLLLVGLLEPANLFLAIALGALAVRGAAYGPIAVVVASLALLLTVTLTSVCATLAAGLLGPGAARGRDIGTLVVAVAISLLAMTGTLLPSLLAALRQHSLPWLSNLLLAMPTGWGSAATAAAGRSTLPADIPALVAIAPLLGLVALIFTVCLVWPRMLARRMEGHRPLRHGTRRGRPRRLLATNATTTVMIKELRLWVRDPIRLTCLVIALVVGTGTCIVPMVTAGTSLLLPYGGAMTAVIAAACACNLYGNDGPALWLTVTTPRSARPDVRGRQLAWLTIVGPYALVSTLALTAVAGRPAAWAWALGLLAALIGGGAGLAALASVIAVQPLDGAGNPTPAWSLKIHIALLAVALTAAPPLLVLLVGGGWWAVPVGVISGLALAIGCGHLAVNRLAHRQVSILQTLTHPTPAGALSTTPDTTPATA